MKDKVNPILDSEIQILKKEFEVLTFPNDFDLVYEGQVPCTAIALIKGHIEIFKDSKTILSVDAPNLLGVTQLLEGMPVKYGCRVKANSQIILLGKSDILSFTKRKSSKNHPLKKVVNVS